MSKRSDGVVSAEALIALGARGQQLESFATRELTLGSITVRRALPVGDKRLVGPWCFLDRFGPLTFTGGKPMDVAPHPHIGLQTDTWLLEGEVMHDDSLGCEAVLRPGGVNVMTSGAGITHAEQTPREHTGRLNGVQLWTALLDADRHTAAAFHSVPEVPIVEATGGLVQIFAGSLGDHSSPAFYFSDLVGADLQLHAGHTLELPLEAGYEHAVLVLDGKCTLDGQRLDEGVLYYLGTSRSEAAFGSTTGARVLLIGGPPFPEAILMWWNFVARTPEEIERARTDWEEHRRFGGVPAYKGPRLSAPSLTRLARPGPVS
jgi:redox-sensitive bicupin YhaK (pirin superfamily)